MGKLVRLILVLLNIVYEGADSRDGLGHIGRGFLEPSKRRRGSHQSNPYCHR